MKLNNIKKLKDIKLSESEKRELFKRISNSIQKEDADIKLFYPVPSPFFRFSFLLENKHIAIGVLSIFILFITTSATAFASLNTLPGDLLYGVKINVVEKIPRLMYLTPESRALDNSKKIEKRINEYEKLVEKGRLTKKNTEKIEEDINKNFGDFDENVRKMKQKRIKIQKENSIEAELESDMEEYTEKIEKIRENEKVSDKRALQSALEKAHSSREKLRKEIEDEEEEQKELKELKIDLEDQDKEDDREKDND